MYLATYKILLQMLIKISAFYLEVLLFPKTNTAYWSQEDSGESRTKNRHVANGDDAEKGSWVQGKLTFLEAWYQLVNNVLHGSVMTAKENRRWVIYTIAIIIYIFYLTTS